MGGSKLCLFATVGVVGVVIAVVGASFLHFYPIIFDTILKEETRLVEGSTGYETWRLPPADIFIDFYVWHLENPLEVEKGAKPNVTQRGPYTYRENRKKDFVEKHDNGTLSYVQPENFIYDPVHSVGDPKKDTFTTINMPLLTIINMLQYMPKSYENLFDILATLAIDHVHSTHTVHDFVWGYFSTLLFLAKQLEPDKVPLTTFGIYTGKNNSNDGVYTVFDGVDDYRQTNTIDRWKGMKLLPYWITQYGNMINGSDGSYFGQFMSQDDELYVFVSDICRSVYLTYEKDLSTCGIPTWRYTVPPILFANQTQNPANEAFCTPDPAHCVPGGILNLTLCQFGAPIYFSAPHFLYAEKKVLQMVNGVHPVKELHQTFMDVEPLTGAPLNISKRSQINTYVRSYDFIQFYKHVPEAYVPLVWMDERSVVTQAGASSLTKQLLVPITIGQYFPWVAVGLGLLLALIGVLCFVRRWKKRDVSLSTHNIQGGLEEERPLI